MVKYTPILFALLLIPLTTYGATLLVPDQYPTIQAGINASTNGDTVLVASGTYSGGGNFDLDFGGRAIVLMAEYGPENTIIDCGALGRGIYFHSGETGSSVVEGIAITGGSMTYGGGINVTASSPTFRHCIIYSNSSANSYGGGFYISNGSPTIVNCTVAGNTSKYGGGVYLTNSSPVINSCIVVDNTATG
jgi:hypothetical protein